MVKPIDSIFQVSHARDENSFPKNKATGCSIEGLNLIGYSTEKVSFPFSKAYPLPKTYSECVLPSNHPWAKKATMVMTDIRTMLQGEWKRGNYTILGSYPELILTRDDLPFVVKVARDQQDPNYCIKRVLIAERVNKFIKEKGLDLQPVQKFLVPRDPHNNSGEEFSCRTYGVIAEKMNISTMDNYCARKIEQLKDLNRPISAKLKEKERKFPVNIWNSIPVKVRDKRKKDSVFLCSQLGLEDFHTGNEVLLENGTFGNIDLGEHNAGKNFNSLLYLQNNSKEDEQGILRDQEIEMAKKGLFKYLIRKDTATSLSAENNRALYNQSITALEIELLVNKIYREGPAERKENIKERVFFRNRKIHLSSARVVSDSTLGEQLFSFFSLENILQKLYRFIFIDNSF